MAAPHLLADFTAIRQNLVTISGTLEIYYKNHVLTESNIIKIGSNYIYHNYSVKEYMWRVIVCGFCDVCDVLLDKHRNTQTVITVYSLFGFLGVV